MKFTLTPTYDDNPRLADLVGRLRDFLSGELAEYEADRQLTPETRLGREVLEPVWKRSRELGFYGIHLPERFGGQGLSFTELAALKEEVERLERRERGLQGRYAELEQERRDAEARIAALEDKLMAEAEALNEAALAEMDEA